MKAFADLADLPEDERIQLIANTAKHHPGSVIGVAVDDEDEKIERYKKKLRAHGLTIIDVKPGPVAKAKFISVRFAH